MRSVKLSFGSVQTAKEEVYSFNINCVGTLVTDQNAFWEPSFGGFPGSSPLRVDPRADAKKHWKSNISLLVSKCLGISQVELESVTGERVF